MKLRKYKLCMPLLLCIVLFASSGCTYKNESSETEYNDSFTDESETILSEEYFETGSEVIVENTTETEIAQEENTEPNFKFDINEIPTYSVAPYIELNNNVPLFVASEITTKSFEFYSNRDELNRCGVAFANVCEDTMPTEERGPIGSVRPSGWHTVKYNDLIDGNYLYNRCHLIGYQLAGENANEDNLITGTRYLNVQGMLPFENMVSGYVERTGNHVLYRVTPIFEGKNLVASGITMEAYSVEDEGKGICFYVYVYNVQPGIIIDYLTGDSCRDSNYTGINADNGDYGESQVTEIQSSEADTTTEYQDNIYVINTNTHKFHYPSCSSVTDMKEKNKKVSSDTRDKIIEQGYSPCKRCNP